MSGLADLDPTRFAELRRLLDEGLDLPAAERAAWLAGLPEAQQPLRERLERLLAEADDEAGAAAFDTLPPMSAPAAAASTELPGDIGPWRPQRLLGEGGMGTVWLAERIDGLLKRPAALKLPRGAWHLGGHAGLAERMARERDILARLDHPHIAPILDAGVTPEGQPWLALAFVEGQPIDEYVAQRQLGLRERIGLLLQVAGAVAHAHARLVVHRDLKPGNILVTPEGEVRLLDFGIGKLLDDEAGEGLALTQQLGRVMTPWYASPEQVQGQPIGTASDVYALGVVAFELLSGRRPYALKQETRVELERAIVEGRTQRPSAVADTPWAAQLRGDLDTVILKALKTAPDERYRTVDQFADDLQRWLRQRPVSAQPDRLAYRVRKFVARNRLGVGLGTAAVAALAVALGVALWQREQARLEAAKANGIKDYLVSLFETNDVDQSDALRKRGQSVQDLLEHSARTLGSGLAEHPEVRDELQKLVGQLLQDLELGTSALKLRQERVQALQAQRAPPHQQAEALRALAQSQYWSDDADTARKTLELARGLCASEPETVNCLGVLSDLGQMDFDARHLDQAMATTEPVVARLRAVAPASAELAQALELLGNIQLARNEVEDSLILFHASMEIRRALFGERSVRLAALRYRLGRNLWVARQLSQADLEFRAARDITRSTLGEDHPLTLRIEFNLGRLTSFIGVRNDGLPMLEHAVSRMIARTEPMQPSELLPARVALGSALLLDGHLDQARGELEAAMALRAQLGPGQAYSDPSLDQSWARLLMDTGRYADARQALETMHRQIVATYGEKHPLVADVLIRQAGLALAHHDLAQASGLLQQALATQDNREASYGSPKHRAQLLQATVLMDSGRPLDAALLLEPGFAVAQTTARGDLFRDPLFQLTMLMARLRCAQGRHLEGEALFERAIALMRPANNRHPQLIDAHARLALCLADHGASESARAQWQQAELLWSAQPGLGQHLRRGLDEVRRQAWARPVPP